MSDPRTSRHESPNACLRCGTEMRSMGIEEFRSGGTDRKSVV